MDPVFLSFLMSPVAPETQVDSFPGTPEGESFQINTTHVYCICIRPKKEITEKMLQ